MAERQEHGFTFENYIKSLYKIQNYSNSYTSQWDGILNNYPVSIKLEKIGTDIELASFTRNASITEDFYLIVGFWEDSKDNIISIKKLFISGNQWHNLFNQEIVNKCQNLINTISNSPKDDDFWRNERIKLTKEWKKTTPNLIRPRFKRDHKTQKRMQCAINNKDFFKYFIPKYEVE